MVKMNEIETKSFEVVPVIIDVVDHQTDSSRALIRKYYSLGRKKNGDKYFKITGIAEFYKQHAKNLQKDAVVIILPKNLLQQDNSVKLQVRLNDNVYLSFEEKDLGVIKYWQESYKGHLSSNWIEGTLEGMEVVIKQQATKSNWLKNDHKYFEAQEKGNKNFEIRKNDRGYQVGDLLFLHEYENNQYTGRLLVRKVTYITAYKQKEGYVVLGTKRL